MGLFSRPSYDWLVVGLGNPGEHYERTRHNVGFRVMDNISQSLGVKVNRAKFKALTAAATVGDQKVLLLKPQTFMNASGIAVEAAAAYYKIPVERILVISDDISLPVGKIRVRASGSAGGHNGLKSIISSLGGKENFPRVKVGVGEKPNPEYDLADWVLGRFTSKEEQTLSAAMQNAADAVEMIIRSGTEKAAAAFNGL